MFTHFNKTKAKEYKGRDRDWNVDLVPKFLMANGRIPFYICFVCFMVLAFYLRGGRDVFTENGFVLLVLFHVLL